MNAKSAAIDMAGFMTLIRFRPKHIGIAGVA
jgi:hypothetical protein